MIFAWVFGFIILHMTVVWGLYRWLHNPGIVDVGWASGITLSGWLYLLSQPLTQRSLILGALLLIWGVRLGGYIYFTRIRLGHVDKRYIALSDGWKMAKPLGFFLNFQLQGLLIFLMVIPWYFIATAPVKILQPTDFVLIALVIVALIGETIADNQLQQFKKQHPGAVCNTGLWHYSRHPNYFCEWLIWFAFGALALQLPLSLLSVISPLTLYLLMTQVTGPMTEAESLKSRGKAYEAYQKSTPYFFPW